MAVSRLFAVDGFGVVDVLGIASLGKVPDPFAGLISGFGHAAATSQAVVVLGSLARLLIVAFVVPHAVPCFARL